MLGPDPGRTDRGSLLIDTKSDPLRSTVAEVIELEEANSLYSTWDDQFYAEQMGGWMVKVNAIPREVSKLDQLRSDLGGSSAGGGSDRRVHGLLTLLFAGSFHHDTGNREKHPGFLPSLPQASI